MTPVIRIDDQVWAALKSRAEPLEDSPNDVLRRVLGLDDDHAGARLRHEPVLRSSRIRREAAAGQHAGRRDRIRDFLEKYVLQDGEPGFDLDETNRVWIGFFPKSWTSPHLLTGSRKYGRILWIQFENRPAHLRMHVEIKPGDPGTRARIHEVVHGRYPFETKHKMTSEWTRVFRKDILTSDDFEAHGHDDEWLQNRIKEKWSEFKASEFPLIDEVIRNIDFGD
jgi:hypothetical protein